MSFVTNHDTDRNAGEYLGHRDGATFILANEWLLASVMDPLKSFQASNERPATTHHQLRRMGASPTLNAPQAPGPATIATPTAAS
jgi:hypothetical protein